jgi:hypothetical protein
MKTTSKHCLLAASLLALAPCLTATADETKPDVSHELEAKASMIGPDGEQREIEINELQLQLDELLKTEADDVSEMLRKLMKQIPLEAGKGPASSKPGGEPGIKFESKAFMIGPDGEKREIEINELQLQLDELLGMAAGETEGELPAHYIGVAVEPVPEAVREHLDLPKATGVSVVAVFEGSPAATAGIRENDLIVKADGQVLSSRETVLKAVAEAQGREMKLEVVRAGKTEEVMVKPAKRELPLMSELFVPKIGAAPEDTDDLEALHEEVRNTHKLLEQMLKRLEALEKAGE